MIDTIYVEEEVLEHPRTAAICRRFPRASRVVCGRYGEVFNRRRQSFRLQKQRPALVLARKHQGLVHATPPGYGIGDRENYYFSHMLNCPYDCRYCFLQGMYRSAHHVLFVNYEDFQAAIAETLARSSTTATFFSGYDCDSLAFEGVSGFAASFLPFFARHEGATLELRTKSTHVEPLRSHEPFPGCVVAWSFTPAPIAAALEHKTPAIARRARAMRELAERGWRLGLRLDPLIWTADFEQLYRELLAFLFEQVPVEAVHSVSLGPFRLPHDFHRTLVRLHPKEPFLAAPMAERDGLVSYRQDLELELRSICQELLARHVPAERIHPCS